MKAEGCEHARGLGLAVLAGAFTPSEAHAAWSSSGTVAVKLFPASAVGPSYLAAVLEPFPDMAVVPVGGVRIEGVAGWLSAGAIAVGLGRPLLGDALRGGSQAALSLRAAKLMRRVRAHGDT